MHDLKARVVASVRWTVVSAAVVVILQTVRMLVLARIVGPEAFGVMAVVAVVVGFSQLFAQLGLSEAVIQRKVQQPEVLSSLYWANVGFGFTMFLLVAGSAPIISRVMDIPALVTILPVAALTLVLSSLGAQFQALLRRELQFNRIATYDIVSAFTGTMVALGCAWLLGMGVWALVAGLVAESAIRATQLMSWGWRAATRPTRRFRIADLEGYLGFGLKYAGGMIANYFNGRIDQLVIGGIMGVQSLGYYNIGVDLTKQPISKINPILTRIAFPVFSKIQDDQERIRRGYLQMFRLLLMVNLPIFVGLAAVAPVAIPLVMGDAWRPAVPIVEILAFYALFRSFGHLSATVILARGHAGFVFYWNVALLAIVPVVALVTSKTGSIVVVAAGMLVLQVVIFSASYWLRLRPILGPFARDLFAVAWPTALSALGMALAVKATGLVLSGVHPAPRLAVMITVGMGTYALFVLTLQRDVVRSLITLALARRASSAAAV